MRGATLVGVALLLVGCEGAREEPTTPPSTTASTLWNALGTWSGTGARQTESFDVTSGALRLVWDADEAASDTAFMRVALHSSISGRPLATLVDVQGAGAGTAHAAANPRVAYLRIESEGLRWRVTLEEAVQGS